MQFDSFSAFLAMGGYGFYVWLSFGASFTLILLLVISSLRASKATKLQIANQVKREQKLKLAAQQQAAQQASQQSSETGQHEVTNES